MTRSRALLVSLLAVSLQLACSQPVEVESPDDRPDVLLITVDTLRADHLTPYGSKRGATPNIAGLAREGTLFEAAMSPMQLTRPSHYSILTSLYPKDHGVVNNKISLEPGFLTVTEVFREAGYQTAAFVAVTLIGPNSGAERAFDHFSYPRRSRTRPANEVVEEARRWFDDSSRDKPRFVWIHLFDPHTPYAPPDPFAPDDPDSAFGDLREASIERLIEISRENGNDLPRAAFERAVDLYQGDVGFADHWLGVLIEKLRREETLDDTIVALTADHGECFENGIYFEHGDCLYEGAARVPLIIRYPASVPSGARRSEVVELLDVAPTLLSLSSIPVPERFLGRALFDESDPPRGAAYLQHPFYSNVGVHNRRILRLDSVAGQPTKELLVAEEQLGVRTREWKYLLTGEREELYHLVSDPMETRNVADSNREVAADLRARLEAWSERHPQYNADNGQINDELRATLKALGYVH